MSLTSAKGLRAHYQWVIVACCFLLMFVNVGLPSTSFNVYQPYIVAIPDVGDAGGSLVLTIRAGFSFIALLYAVGGMLASVGVSLWSVELSDDVHRAQNIQRFQTWYAAGGTLFNLVPGILKGFTGTYATSYVIILLGTVFYLAIVLLAYRQKKAMTGSYHN